MALAARSARSGLDPWDVLHPGDQARRIVTEALTVSAERAAELERELLAVAVGDRVATVMVEVLVAAGILQRKT